MDYWPSYIPKPSSLTESVDDPYIEATSETGDDAARVRYSKERQGPTKLTWKIMRLGDFVALKQFYAEHRAIEFLWLHPSRGLTYKTRFVSSPISSSEDGKSPFVAQVEVTLQVVELAPNEQDQPSVDDLMETVNEGADRAVQAALDAGTARDAAQEAARQAATTAAEVLTSVEAGKQELQDEAQTQITAIESAGNEQIAAVQAEGATQTAAAKAQADAAAASAQEAADRLNEFKDLGATATTLAAGSEATASFDSSTGVLTIGVPQGIQGEAATIEVGTVTTLEPGASATVTNSGTDSEAVFDFGIPKGDSVALSDAVDSESSTTAASSKAVKTAYDEAKNKLPLSGGTLTGNLEVNGNISSQKLVLTDVEISRIFSDGVRLITFSGKEGDHGLSMRYSPDYGELYLDGRAIHGKADNSAFADEAQNSYGLKGIDIISGATYALPGYGTWKYAYMVSDPGKFIDFVVGESAGGATLSAAGYGGTAFMEGLAFRSA